MSFFETQATMLYTVYRRILSRCHLSRPIWTQYHVYETVSVRFSEYELKEEIHFGWHLHAKFYICQCNVSTLRGQKTKFVLPEWFK